MRCKPAAKVVLVSDGVATGCPDGDYELFGSHCVVAAGTVRLKAGGQLAGSCLSLDQAVRNVHRWQPALPLPALLRMGSGNAARAVGLAEQRGTLAPGKEADIVLLDSQLSVVRTLRAGETVFARRD
jgi:N-acetylglucosamine-6-phosphate deacetylase